MFIILFIKRKMKRMNTLLEHRDPKTMELHLGLHHREPADTDQYEN
jgi:hypothetical protein